MDHLAERLGMGLRRLEALDRPRFLLAMIPLTLILRLLAAPLFVLTGGGRAGFTPADVMTGEVALVAVLVLAPALETLIGQWLPLGLMGRLRLGTAAVQVLAAAAWFGLLHTPGFGLGGFLNGFVGGLPLAYTFLRWRRVNLLNALGMTTALHASLNALAYLVYLGLVALGLDLGV